MKRLSGIKFFAGLMLLVGLVLLVNNALEKVTIVRLDNIFSPEYGYPADLRERYFAGKFPTSNEIADYLSDATILHSRPPTGNQVFYFDNNRHFLRWHDSRIKAGEWSASPYLQVMILGERWRVVVARKFCMWISDVGAFEQQDSCYAVSSLDSILVPPVRGRLEYRKGNPLNLNRDTKRAPALSDHEISIDSLLVAKAENQGDDKPVPTR